MGYGCQPACSNLVEAMPWKHDLLYPLICEQAVLNPRPYSIKLFLAQSRFYIRIKYGDATPIC